MYTDPLSRYNSLPKPSWAPSFETFNLVGIVVYIILFVMFLLITLNVYSEKLHKNTLFLFILGGASLMLFNPVFFGLQSSALSLFLLVFTLILFISIFTTGLRKAKFVSLTALIIILWVTLLSYFLFFTLVE